MDAARVRYTANVRLAPASSVMWAGTCVQAQVMRLIMRPQNPHPHEAKPLNNRGGSGSSRHVKCGAIGCLGTGHGPDVCAELRRHMGQHHPLD